MNGDQVAKAAKDSQIVQSQRDTNIGYSADDMKGIIETLADQVPKFAAIATAIVDARLQTFEDKVMARFGERSTTNSEAFADPDFQYLLSRAQYAYARSGDDKTADILVDLIAQRSMQTQRNRLALSLNDAVEKSAYLTVNEFAELSLAYLLRRTIRQTIVNFPALCEFLKDNAGPFVADISRDDSSYSYLASQSCGSIEMGEILFMQILQSSYGGFVSSGTELATFEAILGPNHARDFPNILMTCIHDRTKFQVNATNKDVLGQLLENLNASGKLEPLWEAHSSGFMTKERFIEAATPHYPDVSALVSAWDETPMKSLNLTSVGLAIGFANLKRVTGFEADLGIWIK